MKKLQTITVGELIARLQGEDPDAQVVFASDYGDRGRTRQAHAIRGHVEEALLHESAYSDSGFALSDDDADQDGEQAVLVIR